MRVLGRLLFFGVLGIFVGGLLLAVGSRFVNEFDLAKNGVNTSNAFPVLAYALSQDAAMEFSLHGAGSAVRLISNAVLTDDAPVDASARYNYGLHVEFLDRHGAVIDSQQYVHKTRMEWVSPTDEFQGTRSVTVLEESTSSVAGSRAIRLPLTGRENARSFRVRLVSKDESVARVLARFYQHEALLQHQIDRLWHRLKLHARKRLAEASVYAQSRSLLTDAEKRNLMRNRWRPNGPLDNRIKPTRLFVWRDANQKRATMSLQLPMVPTTSLDRLLVADGGALEWQLVSEVSASPGAGVTVNYEWFGEHKWQTQSDTVTTDEQGRAMVQLPAGLVFVQMKPGYKLRVFNFVAGERVEQQALIQRVRSYRVDDTNTSVTYTVSHVPGHKTPFRLDLRRPIDHDDESAIVIVTLRDKAGQALDRASFTPVADAARSGLIVTLPALASRLDRVATPSGLAPVSDRVQVFWALPANVASVEITSQSNALISAYTRPDDLPHRVSVAATPADPMTLLTAHSNDRVPVWFSLAPDNAGVFSASGHLSWLHIQTRPPTVNDKLADVDTRFEQLKPIDLRVSQEVVLERVPGQPWRNSALPGALRPLPLDRVVTVDFKPLPGSERVSPTLIYRRVDGSDLGPFKLTLMHAKSVWFEQTVTGASGQVRLPPIAPGSASLRARTSVPVELLINMSGVSDTVDDRSRRVVYQLNTEPLEFTFQRDEPLAETVAIRWFSEAEYLQPVRILARLENARRPGQADGWTLYEREFEVQTRHAGLGYLVGRRPRQVGAGQVFYIGIGTDLAPGDYRITLQLLSDTPGYVALSRLDEEDRVGRGYLVEKDIDH